MLFSSNIIFIILLWTIGLLSSILMIGAYNPVYSTLFMILAFISVSVSLVFLGVEYLGLIFLMVYVGAIAILFLFVVMMVPIKQFEIDNSVYLTVGVTFFFLLMLGCYQLTHISFSVLNFETLLKMLDSASVVLYSDSEYHHRSVGRFLLLGHLLYKYYYIHLYICGLCLFVAMVGSIFLINEQEGRPIQISRHKQLLQVARLHSIRYSLED